MAMFETLKLFDLAQTPPSLRDATELEPLRPSGAHGEAGIVMLHVSRLGLFDDAGDNDGSQAVSLTEHLLYRWLIESGCVEGEKVLLTWVDPLERSIRQADAQQSTATLGAAFN